VAHHAGQQTPHDATLAVADRDALDLLAPDPGVVGARAAGDEDEAAVREDDRRAGVSSDATNGTIVRAV
jgi:hypothetical protein